MHTRWCQSIDVDHVSCPLFAVVPFKMNVMFSDGEKLSTSPTSLCGTSRPTAKEADTSDECAAFRSLAMLAENFTFQREVT